MHLQEVTAPKKGQETLLSHLQKGKRNSRSIPVLQASCLMMTLVLKALQLTVRHCRQCSTLTNNQAVAHMLLLATGLATLSVHVPVANGVRLGEGTVSMKRGRRGDQRSQLLPQPLMKARLMAKMGMVTIMRRQQPHPSPSRNGRAQWI